MKSVLYFLRQAPALVALAIGAALLSGVSNIALLSVVNRAIHHPGEAPGLIGSFIGVCLVFMASRFISQVILNDLGKRTMLDLQIELSQRMLDTPLRRLEEAGSPRLIAAITQDVGSLATVATMLPSFCMDVAVVIGCGVYLGWLSVSGQLMLIVLITVGIGLYKVVQTHTVRLLRAIREDENRLFEHLRTLVDGMKELKLNRRRRTEHFAREFSATAASIRRRGVHVAMLFAGAACWALLMFNTMIGVLLFVVPLHDQAGPEAITGSVLTLLLLRSHLDGLLGAFQIFGRGSTALRNLDGLQLAERTTPAAADRWREDETITRGSERWTSLVLDGVTHSYPGEQAGARFVLGPLYLRFEPGQIVFIAGGNGSGKTTFAKLLTGLYTPESGELRLNDQAVHNGRREQYRQYFSAIFSDFHLFEELVSANGVDVDRRAREHLCQLRLDHKVQVANGRLSTRDLSQGQRKRLALLSAYMEDREIYVFDEWAADQDPVFKEVFYYQLLPALKARRKTIFVITHDDRYYHVADRLIKLDYGQVQCDGPPRGAAARDRCEQRQSTAPTSHPTTPPAPGTSLSPA